MPKLAPNRSPLATFIPKVGIFSITYLPKVCDVNPYITQTELDTIRDDLNLLWKKRGPNQYLGILFLFIIFGSLFSFFVIAHSISKQKASKDLLFIASILFLNSILFIIIDIYYFSAMIKRFTNHLRQFCIESTRQHTSKQVIIRMSTPSELEHAGSLGNTNAVRLRVFVLTHDQDTETDLQMKSVKTTIESNDTLDN
ncbi:hypothetical protein BC833DRAFT_622149 [Globomyces pollinis-pini]|nr:hypothetical protein BC833DRAFT_622149 [Globomyces pollinis-pini]